MRRSGVVWVSVAGAAPRTLWHVWHQDADHILHGGGEQQVPELVGATAALVTVRCRQLDGRPLVWTADVSVIDPGSADWAELLPLLVKNRLNMPDTAGAPARWAATSVLSRLTPTGATG